MEKNQIVILEDRGLILVEGIDNKEFLQNIISNDIDKINESNSCSFALFNELRYKLFFAINIINVILL